MKNIISFILFPIAFNACIGPEQKNEVDKNAIILEVQEMFENYYQDIKIEGLTGEFKYLDTSENFFWVPPGYKSALSYDSVKSILETNASNLSMADLSWAELKVFPLSNDIASYTGILEGTVIDKAGNQNDVHIIESGVVIKREDGWKLLSGQTSVIE